MGNIHAMHLAGYPPAVNASSARCNGDASKGFASGALVGTRPERRRLFDGLPQNQAKVMTGYTDPRDNSLVGSFNWTFSLGENLAVRLPTGSRKW